MTKFRKHDKTKRQQKRDMTRLKPPNSPTHKEVKLKKLKYQKMKEEWWQQRFEREK